MTDTSHDLPKLIEECNAIITLFGSIPEYRRDFIKRESPDWRTKPSDDDPSIGLEVVHAYSQAEQQLYLQTKDVSTIEQASKKAVKNNFDQPGVLYFARYIDGCAHYVEYVPSMDLLISDDEALATELGSKAPWVYQNLDSSAKKALSEYALICRRAVQPSDKPNNVLHDSYEFDHPHLDSILIEFRKKLDKLKSYDEFDSNHLAIIYDGIIPDCLSGMPELMASMTMIQKRYSKTFSKVYVLNYRIVVELDLDNHRVMSHCRNTDGWDALRIEKLVIDMTPDDVRDLDADNLYEELPNIDITTNPQYIRHLKRMEQISGDLVPDGNGGLKIRDIAEMMRNRGDHKTGQ